MLRLLKISGHSLEPEYKKGDFVVILKIPFLFWKSISPGDVVIFRHPEYGLMIKIVERLLPDRNLFVVGTDEDSIDSRRFGSISQRDVIGKVIWHIQQ